MFYGEVFKALNNARVKYVVVGGTAVVLHGYMRLTNDLDLVVDLEENNLDKFFNTLKKINYHPKVPVTKEQFKDPKQRQAWRKEKKMIVLSFYKNQSPFPLIDVFIYDPIPFDQLYNKRIRAKIKGMTIPIISINHLKRLKKLAGRPQDLMDIVQLEAIQRLQ